MSNQTKTITADKNTIVNAFINRKNELIVECESNEEKFTKILNDFKNGNASQDRVEKFAERMFNSKNEAQMMSASRENWSMTGELNVYGRSLVEQFIGNQV